jgi:hypothetical protein
LIIKKRGHVKNNEKEKILLVVGRARGRFRIVEG